MSTSKLLGMHRPRYKVATGNRGRSQRGRLQMPKLLNGGLRIVVDPNPRGQCEHKMKGHAEVVLGSSPSM